ncbi:SH3 domain-containing protein [Mameliella sp. CS4]|uniref:SH3 domain-containing protein n=1 Tax=Mameliella sp. CS4 TaxID=2862329 RepID=UPI001C5D3407|nr:SH3 domain-containing protein [Mameliella sp. CS4]MBW4983096.1 SH3 domain-containing protein [Mameliella sp. CS4]
MRILAVIGFFLLQSTAAMAATVELRPDLAPRLEALRPVYPNETPVLEVRELWGTDDWQGGIIRISGTIEAGDLDKLKALAGSPNGEVRLSRPLHVVLDSPGGSLTEGIAIGEYLQQWRGGNFAPGLGGVFVLKGDRCLSACALAFALSALPRDKGAQERFVEVGAELGFHMPFIRPELATRLAEAGETMELAFDTMALFLSLIANGQTPPALAQNVIHYRGAEQMFILRGGLVTRVLGFDPVATGALVAPVTRDGLTDEDVRIICGLLDQTRQGGLPTRDSYETWMFVEPDCRELGGFAAALAGDGPAITAAVLADVLGCHGGRLTTEYFGWDWDNAFLEEEFLEERQAQMQAYGFDYPRRIDWQRETLATVRLRDAPGLAGATVGRVQAGNKVTVTECAVTEDAQGVWFKISGSRQDGWVSARFVSRREREANLLNLIRPIGFE